MSHLCWLKHEQSISVGWSSDEKGEDGKYLILTPGFEGTVPDDDIVKDNDTFDVHFAIRPITKNDGTHED